MFKKTHYTKTKCLNWLCVGALLASGAGFLAAQTTNALPNTYLVHNLVSDLANTADYQDSNLINPWGVGFGATPFWVWLRGA